MKTLLLLLGFLVPLANASAEIVIANRNTNAAFFTLTIAQDSGNYVVACQVPAADSVVIPGAKMTGALTFVALQSTGGAATLDLTAGPIDVSGLVNLVYLANGGLSSHFVPASSVPNYWDWWFKGFGLGIGFCALGSFVRMIRMARGTTSLEL